jgi:TetR/AcrR family transcriptional regulator, transcriptional repressor for nem operon
MPRPASREITPLPAETTRLPDHLLRTAGQRRDDLLIAERAEVLDVELARSLSFGWLAGQLVESDPETRADLAGGFTQWLDLFREGLEAMKASGELRDDADPEALAFTLLTSMQGGMLLAQTLRDAEPLQTAFTTALARVASFAADPAGAPRILRLSQPQNS